MATTPSVQQLRDAIPKHCFQSDLPTSLYYVGRDIAFASTLAALALMIPSLESAWLRGFLWVVYGFLQGLVFTGIWIIAHECGHRALFRNDLTNDVVGFSLHSFLLVPYFSWKYSHSKHHRYTNHMEKDTAFVPVKEGDTVAPSLLQQALHIGEDSPLMSLGCLVTHQLVGWPLYLLCGITAGRENIQASRIPTFLANSHFNPAAQMFTPRQKYRVMLSNFGLIAVILLLAGLVRSLGWATTFLIYGIPYLWVNHWIVAITYLHHNHPSSEHFESDAWTFERGQRSTIDRDFGFVGRKIFHGIIEYHVVHHLFT